MNANKLAATMGKGLLVANLAVVLRVLLHGFRNLDSRLYESYMAINPFGAKFDPRAEAVGRLLTIPDVGLQHVVTDFSPLLLDNSYRCIEGSLPWVDLTTLLAIVRDRKPRVMLEIGTYFGHTARLLALNLPDCVVHTIDLPETFDPRKDETDIPKDDFHLIKKRRVGEAFRSDPSIKNVVQHFGDTASWDYSPVKDATVYFIDGSHTYEYIRNDTEKCLALCQERRATLLWHDVDVGHLGVVRYLAELVEGGRPVKLIGGTHMALMDC